MLLGKHACTLGLLAPNQLLALPPAPGAAPSRAAA